MAQVISNSELRREAWKYYVVAIAWPTYMFFLPWLWAYSWWLAVLAMIFPGVWLYTWVAELSHECWHKYVPNVPNDAFYVVFSQLLFTDPQVYRVVHGHHHSEVNTWQDAEFHPLGRINNSLLRRIYNLFEILLGVIFTFGLLFVVLPTHPRYREKFSRTANLVSVGISMAFYVLLGFAAAAAFKVTFAQILVPWLLANWFGSFFIHQDQLIEHGNLIAEGDIKTRMLATRNLAYKGVLAKAFLFLTHGDSREHVLHHTAVREDSRPFPGRIPMPEGAIFITLSDHMRNLWSMVLNG